MYTSNDHTFVICAYKTSSYLEEAITSILKQSIKPQVIISTSTPNESIEGCAKKYNIPVFVHKNSRGLASDWNFGYQMAKTPLVTIAHQDDVYEPAYLEKMLAALNQYETGEVAILFSHYFELRKGSRVYKNKILRVKRLLEAPFSRRNLNNKAWFQRRMLGFGCFICCPSVLFVKDAVPNPPFDEKYKNSCDFKTWVNFTKLKKRFVFVPEPLMGHRIHQESATTEYISSNLRKNEDLEIFSELMPKPLAKLLNRVYSTSEKSNSL